MSNLKKEIKSVIEKHRKEQQRQQWALDLNHEILVTSQSYVAHFNKQHAEQNIRHPSLPILFDLLHNGGRMSQKQLSRSLNVTKQAIAATLKSLEERGLVMRYSANHDRRKRQVQLTDKGISLLQTSIPIRSAFYTRFMKHISEDEAENLIAGLQKINAFYEREIRKLTRTQGKDRSTTNNKV